MLYLSVKKLNLGGPTTKNKIRKIHLNNGSDSKKQLKWFNNLKYYKKVRSIMLNWFKYLDWKWFIIREGKDK